MPKPKILLADNVASSIDAYAEYLEMFGYQVQKVFTPEDCLQALREGQAHLAILDLRMRDDTDEKDISGLTLAKQSNPQIPKIILTAYPTWEMTRESLVLVEHELPPAVGFVSKLEGVEALLKHVQRAFDKYVRINWDLEIDWRPGDRFWLVTAIGSNGESETENHRLPQRADELEDLFRRLFREYDQIRIGEVLWRRPGRIAMEVFAFAKNRMPESMLVVCGRNAEVKDEARRYRNHAPKSSSSGGATLHLSAETTHFAANAYAVGSFDLDSVRTLNDLYRADAKAYAAAVATLYEQTLADWAQEKRKLEEAHTLDDLYRAGLDLTPAQISQSALTAKIQALVRRLPTIGLRAESRDGELTLHFNDSSVVLPDPAPFVFKMKTAGGPVVLINSPGALSGDSVLIDRDGRVLLTDFAAAGPSPLLWNYVALEAAIRFDWVESSNLRWLRDLEQCLIEEDFTRFDPRDFEAPLQKTLRAIQQIRLIGYGVAAQDLGPYHLGVFYHAASRLAHTPLTPQTTNAELARLAHLLISTAMTARLISSERPSGAKPLAPEEVGIYLDADNYEARVDGVTVRLTEQEFKLLDFLYIRANQICASREIIEQVLEYRYDEKLEANVHTAINRLRKKIEPHPHSRRYIRNERGRGYRLVLDQ